MMDMWRTFMSERIWAVFPKTQEVKEVHPSMTRVGWVPIIRDTSVADHMREQLALYAPCACGSGKKYKWCCR